METENKCRDVTINLQYLQKCSNNSRLLEEDSKPMVMSWIGFMYLHGS